MRVHAIGFVLALSWALLCSRLVASFQVQPNRRDFLRTSAATAAGWLVANQPNQPASAAEDPNLKNKLVNLSDDKLKEIITNEQYAVVYVRKRFDRCQETIQNSVNPELSNWAYIVPVGDLPKLCDAVVT